MRKPSTFSRIWDQLRGRTPLPRNEEELDDFLYGPGTKKEQEEIRDWMRKQAATYDAKERIQTDVLLKWLPTAGPEDWHRCAVTFNWDYLAEPLQWIAEQPDCDRGTAIFLFHRNRPGHYAQISTTEEEFWRKFVGNQELVTSIAERWRAGGYPNYRFDPVVRETVEPGSLPWPVPDDLCAFEVAGEPLDLNGFEDGYPPHLIGAKLV